jgi:hypothetical protein
MRDYKTLQRSVLNAFDSLYNLRDKKVKQRRQYEDFGMTHSHVAESTYDVRGNRTEEYEYSGWSASDKTLDYGFEISNFKNDSKERSEIYIGLGGMIKYHLNPKFLDDILVRIKMRAGEECEEYSFHEVCEEGNHFMLSTAISSLPELDELMAFYEFAQKIRPMMMQHKCFVSGNLPQRIMPNLSYEFLEMTK